MPRRHLIAGLSLLCVAAAAHDPIERIQSLDGRIAAAPDDPVLRLERGELYRRIGRLDRALADFDRVVGLDATHREGLYARALVLLALDRADEALAAAERLAAAHAANGAEQWLRAQALARLGRACEAADAFLSALPACAPRTPDHWRECALALSRCGDDGIARALAVLDRGLGELGPCASLGELAIDLELRRGAYGAAVARATDGRAAALRVRAELARPAPPPRLPIAPDAAAVGPARLVTANSLWRYLDDGSDQGSLWTESAFDDRHWAFGLAQLGYGDGDEWTVVGYGPDPDHKYVTTYFRRPFQVADPTAFQSACLRLLHDDGAVVWLNGVEVVRSNLPQGPIGYRTLATVGVAGAAESTFFPFALDPRRLVAGQNVLAVEIHQVDPGSSDISFDLELIASDATTLLTRGPYLQRATPTSAIVRWRTCLPTESVVWLGRSPQTLAPCCGEITPKVEHRVEMPGLEPTTRYFYAVGDLRGPMVGGDDEHSFATPPPPGTEAPVRIWAIGDSGTANAAAAAVRDSYLRFAGTRPTDVWLMLGDNAYWSGTDAEYQAAVFDMYPSLLRRTFLWPTIGNHDGLSAVSATQTGVYFDVFSLPRAGEAGGEPSGTEAYYSFDHGNVHFVCLDSEGSDRSDAGAMMAWLRRDLAATNARWIIAFWHHPPYTKGSHDSDNPFDSGGRLFDMRGVALRVLESHGVDLVLTGHSHSYERSFLLDGHYDVSTTLAPHMALDRGDGRVAGDGGYAKPTAAKAPHEGAVHVVAGSSGSLGGGALNHPAMVVSLNELGSLVVDVDGDRLDARFLDWTGAVRDEFTLHKGVQRTLVRDAPRIAVATGGTQNLVLDAGPRHAGQDYLVLGSFATSPGFQLGPVHVPLVQDAWLATSLRLANSSMFQNTAGRLDGAGRARAAIVLPPLAAPSLVGLALHHAFVVQDATGPVLASNPVKLTLR